MKVRVMVMGSWSIEMGSWSIEIGSWSIEMGELEHRDGELESGRRCNMIGDFRGSIYGGGTWWRHVRITSLSNKKCCVHLNARPGI